MASNNLHIYEKIKEYIHTHNKRLQHRCKPLFAVCVLIQGDKLQVCRSRIYRKPNNKQTKRELQHAGGTIEENETPEDAALRELKEETWNDLPDDIRQNYQFPSLMFSQKIYFSQETVIFIHKVPKNQILFEGEIPAPENPECGAGEIENISLVPIKDVYTSLGSKYNGYKWRRCTVWSLKKLRPVFELYAQLEI